MLKLTHPIVIDECRLDVLVETADGKRIRPVLTVLLSEDGDDHGGAPLTVPPFRPTAKGGIEHHFQGFADAVAEFLKNGGRA